MTRHSDRTIKVDLTLTEPEGDYSSRTLVSSELSITLPVPNPEGLGPLVTGAVQALIDVATDKGLLGPLVRELRVAGIDAELDPDAKADPGWPPQDS